MKYLLVVFSLIVLLVGCKSTTASFNNESLTCWDHLTKEVRGGSDELALCLKGNKASLEINHININNESERRTCGQSGEVSLFITDVYQINFSAGGCDNDRQLYPRVFECATRGESIMCLDRSNQYRMLFTPKKDV
jgi:hypothetical protein